MKKILVYSLIFVFSFSVFSFALAKNGGDDNENENESEVEVEEGISLPPKGSIDPILYERLKKEQERRRELLKKGPGYMNVNEGPDDDNDSMGEEDDSGIDGDDDINDDKGGLRNRPLLVPQSATDWSKQNDDSRRGVEMGQKGEAKAKFFTQSLDKKMRGFFVERLNAITNRFDKIITRIQTRIDQLKADGKDTDKAQTFVDTAKTTLEQFKTELAKNKEDLINKSISREAFVTATKAIQDLLKSVQQNLKDAVFELKGIDSDYVKNATDDDNTSGEGSGDAVQQ